MDESFTLEEIEQSELEQAALIPNTDNITTCSCKGICLREVGRNACPCRSRGQYCSSACHGDNAICINNLQALESDSSTSDPSEYEAEVRTHMNAFT